MQQLDAAFVRQVLDSAPDGIAICDATAPDHPVIYVNTAFEQLTGYAAAELVRLEPAGCCRAMTATRKACAACAMLGGARRSLPRGAAQLPQERRAAVERADAAAHARCRRGALTHYVAFFRDAAGRLKQSDKAQEGVPTWLREDRVTGLSSRAWFNELLAREWRIARRDDRPLTLVLFDIDALASYNATVRPSGGRRLPAAHRAQHRGCVPPRYRCGGGVERGLHRRAGRASRRQSACRAWWSMPSPTVRRVAEMHIHHPRAPQKFVTVTAGLATVTPRVPRSDAARLDRAGRERAARSQARHARGALNQAPD